MPDPTYKPTSQPTRQPSTQPSSQPSLQPSRQPSSQPSLQPSRQPSLQPSRQPSSQPSSQPSRRPSRQPTTHPSSQPSSQPTNPTSLPTSFPTISSQTILNSTNNKNQIYIMVFAILISLVTAFVFCWRCYRKNKSNIKQQTGQRGDSYQGHRGGYGGRSSVPNITPTSTPRKSRNNNFVDEEQISPLAPDQIELNIDYNISKNKQLKASNNNDDNDRFNNNSIRMIDQNSRTRRASGNVEKQFNKPLINIKPLTPPPNSQIPMIPITSQSNQSTSIIQQQQQQQQINNRNNLDIETDSLLILSNESNKTKYDDHEDDNVMF